MNVLPSEDRATLASDPGAVQTNVARGRAMRAREDLHYLPSDPGVYGGRVHTTTAGKAISPPQYVSIPFEV